MNHEFVDFSLLYYVLLSFLFICSTLSFVVLFNDAIVLLFEFGIIYFTLFCDRLLFNRGRTGVKSSLSHCNQRLGFNDETMSHG